MKKLLPTFLFYALSFLIIFILNKLSPGAHDGGLGFGAIALILLSACPKTEAENNSSTCQSLNTKIFLVFAGLVVRNLQWSAKFLCKEDQIILHAFLLMFAFCF
jgi:hypothetical protein